jgi:hypothetical protein
MRIFKNQWFTRFAAKEGVTDEELKAMVNQLETGRADAGMGGDVYKVREPVRGLANPRALFVPRIPGYRVFQKRGADVFSIWLCKVRP